MAKSSTLFGVWTDSSYSDIGVKLFRHAAFLEMTGRFFLPLKYRQSRSNSGVLDLGKEIVSVGPFGGFDRFDKLTAGRLSAGEFE